MDDDFFVDDESGALLQENVKVIRRRNSSSPKKFWGKRTCHDLFLYFLFLLMTPFTVLGFLKSIKDLRPASSSIYHANTVRPEPPSLQPYKKIISFGNTAIYGEEKLVRFEPEVKFRGPSAAEAWESLFPVGDGFIQVAEEDSAGLGPPVKLGDQQGYCISVFHQLHCLASIHKAFWDPTFNLSAETVPHLEHCFDYVRQQVMCAADTALEHAQPGIPEQDSVDGWGIVHQCRDWSLIWEFAEDHAM